MTETINPRRISDPAQLAELVKAGDKRAVARAITIVENDEDRAAALIDALHGAGGQAFVFGLTGPPGAGKSTLTAALVGELLEQGHKVGVIAVDPTSPYSGGALLGDRVRMGRIASNDDVFIRSMATRGSLGGLSRKTVDAIIVLDAAGYDRIIVETVGVGQSEVEIASTADTTVVVLSPEAGDGIQAMKAGLMEVADVFCVNKADRDGADRLVREITAAVSIAGGKEEGWAPDVTKTVARSGEGVPELLTAIENHHKRQTEEGVFEAARRRNSQRRISFIASDALTRELLAGREELLEALAEAVVQRTKTPYRAAEELVDAFLAERLKQG